MSTPMLGVPVLWPLGAYAALVVALVAGVLAISRLLGERGAGRGGAGSALAGNEPYESGVPGAGSARVRISPHFYLIGVFFVIFDLEAVFLVAWAVAAEEAGWVGFVEIAVFVAVLLAALAYLWRDGGLEVLGPTPGGRGPAAAAPSRPEGGGRLGAGAAGARRREGAA